MYIYIKYFLFRQCFDDIQGNGTCTCNSSYTGTACELCKPKNNFGLSCDKSKFVYIYICLFVCLFVCLFIHSIVHSSIYLFHCPFVHSALCPFLFLLLLLHPFLSFTIFCQTAHASMVPVIMVLMAMERVRHNPVKMVILVMIVRQL